MSNTLSELSLPIGGMSCASCVAHVEGALKGLPGVSNVVVNLATNKASLRYDPQTIRVTDMQRAVDDVGYAIATAELTLDVRGTALRQAQGGAYTSCVAQVETALKELDGVSSVDVNLRLGTANIRMYPGARQADQSIPRPYPLSSHDSLPLHDTQTGPGEVEAFDQFWEDGYLSTDYGHVGLPSAPLQSLANLRGDLLVRPIHGYVVDERDRFRANSYRVVHVHSYAVDADRIPFLQRIRNH